ncbi:MAG: hypothetical protein ACI9HE_002426 [Planctomycetota bacterium]|jgi:hypothetical protein
MEHSTPSNPAPEHELKFVLPAPRSALVHAFLGSRLMPDPGHPGGWVVSVYYDTPDWRFLEEKLASDFLKSKLRLRWYENDEGQPLGTTAFLEVKSKVGSSRNKLRLPVPLTPAELRQLALSDVRFTQLSELARQAGAVLPSPLEPVFTVRYRRRRFVDPRSGLRVSLDDQIHAPKANPLRIPGVRHTQIPFAVVEVKGPSARLPASLRPLRDLGCRLQAFSKYTACHAELTGLQPCP